MDLNWIFALYASEKFILLHVNVNNRKQLWLIKTLKIFMKVISDYLHTRSNTCNYMYKGMVWNLSPGLLTYLLPFLITQHQSQQWLTKNHIYS